MFLVRAARSGLVFSGLRRLEVCMIEPFKTIVRRMRIIMCKCARENLPARDESRAVRDRSAALVRANPELPCPTESEAGCRSFHPGLPPQRRRPVARDPGCGRGGLSASASRYSCYGFAIVQRVSCILNIRRDQDRQSGSMPRLTFLVFESLSP